MSTDVVVYDGLNIPYWKRRTPYEVAAFNTDWGRVVFAEGEMDGLVHRFFDLTRPGAAEPSASTHVIVRPDERDAEFPTGFMLNKRWIVFSPERRAAHMLPKHHKYGDYRHLSDRRIPGIVLTVRPST